MSLPSQSLTGLIRGIRASQQPGLPLFGPGTIVRRKRHTWAQFQIVNITSKNTSCLFPTLSQLSHLNMPSDSAEETKRTLVQSFRAWGGTHENYSPHFVYSRLNPRPGIQFKTLTSRTRKFLPTDGARLAHLCAARAPIPVLPDALPARPAFHKLCQHPRIQDG